jgi:hypothetical protein
MSGIWMTTHRTKILLLLPIWSMIACSNLCLEQWCHFPLASFPAKKPSYVIGNWFDASNRVFEQWSHLLDTCQVLFYPTAAGFLTTCLSRDQVRRQWYCFQSDVRTNSSSTWGLVLTHSSNLLRERLYHEMCQRLQFFSWRMSYVGPSSRPLSFAAESLNIDSLAESILWFASSERVIDHRIAAGLGVYLLFLDSHVISPCLNTRRPSNFHPAYSILYY